MSKMLFLCYFFSYLADAVMTNFPVEIELDLRNAVGKHFKQEIKPIINNFLHVHCCLFYLLK